MTWGRRLLRAAAVAVVWFFAARAEAAAPELAVKAAYIAKFAPFVSWPPAAFTAASSPLVLCVQGDDPFDGLLDQMTAGESVGSHPLSVRRVARLDATSGCQIAYLGGSPAQTRAQALKVLDGQPVLTVTDADSVDGAGGIVRLTMVRGRVRFVIDASKAAQSGLSISSKLLAVAAEVK